MQATESAQQWEKRAQQLQQKYGKVDLAEHQRVQEELKTAQAELSNARAQGQAQLAVVQEDLKKVLLTDRTLCRCLQCNVQDKSLCATSVPGLRKKCCCACCSLMSECMIMAGSHKMQYNLLINWLPKTFCCTAVAGGG